MKTMTILAVAATLAAPLALKAQTTVRAGGSATVRTEAEARGGEERRQARGGARASADVEVQAAVRAGLPEEPVARAAARARARGRSEAEAARAAAEVRTRLETSADVMTSAGRYPSEAEIIAGADAMAQGASRTDLSVIARRAPEDRQLTASFRALGRLGARNGDFGEAAGAIATRLEAGTSDRSIGQLAATGSVDAMLRGSTRGLNAGASAAGGVTGTAGRVLGGGASVTGGLAGGLGGGIIP